MRINVMKSVSVSVDWQVSRADGIHVFFVTADLTNTEELGRIGAMFGNELKRDSHKGKSVKSICYSTKPGTVTLNEFLSLFK